MGEAREHTVDGDRLVGFLKSHRSFDGLLSIDPPPASWAALKPDLLAELVARRADGDPLPRLRGVPLCALGTDYLQLPAGPPTAGSRHPACARCRLEGSCSPPGRWTDELVPFGLGEPLQRWKRYHARLCDLLGTTRRERIDRFVEAQLATEPPAGAGDPYTLETSLLLERGLRPAVRLVVFHGDLPEEPRAAAGRRDALLDLYLALHELLGSEPPRRVADLLSRATPHRFPIGFEADADGIAIKAYVEFGATGDAERRELAEALSALAGHRLPSGLPGLGWGHLGMIGLTTVDGSLRALKLYLHGDPIADRWPELPSLSPDHPMAALAGRPAYAVFDVAAAPRPPKWDLGLRGRLLAGRPMLDALGPLLPAAARAPLRGFVDTCGVRLDLVSVGLRQDRTTLYLEIS